MTGDDLEDVQNAIVEDTKERLAAAQARGSEDLIRLMRALDLSLTATIEGRDDEVDVEAEFEGGWDDALDYGDVHITLTTTRDFEIERVQETDLDAFTSGLKFVAPDGTVVAEPGTDVDMEGVRE